MKTRLIKAFSLVLALWAIRVSGAPIGTAFTYQGRLYEGNVPASGEFLFQFGLFDRLEGGVNLGSFPSIGPALVVPVTNGLFTTTLDFGASAFRGEARFLQVAVRTNDPAATEMTQLQPRQELKPVPYALHALSATEATHATNADLAARVAWGSGSLIGLPDGFADGVDNDTTYSAGLGLTMSGTTFNVNPLFGDGRYWTLFGNGDTDPSVNFLGTTNNRALTMRVNNTTGLRLIPSSAGAPSVVGGDGANSLIFGFGGSVIAGGGSAAWPNQMSGGYYSSIGGGEGNFIRDQHNAIAGGYRNTIGASAEHAAPKHNFIGSGQYNTINADFAVIGGGSTNIVHGHLGFIGGGIFNVVSGASGAVGGGARNTAGEFAAIAGGWHNLAGLYGTAGGGSNNTASGPFTFVGGGERNFVSGLHGAVAGGIANTNTANYASIGGGFGNRASGADAVVAGGSGNAATAGQSTVGGGIENSASGGSSTIAGGEANANLTTFGTIGGGALNYAEAPFSATIAGGFDNRTFGQDSTIGGGSYHFITSNHVASTIAGGQYNALRSDGEGFEPRYPKGAGIAGGVSNAVVASWFGTIAGGVNNLLTNSYDPGPGWFPSDYAVIGGGAGNVAKASIAGVIAGGHGNRLEGNYATISGGESNRAQSFADTIGGGLKNSAEGGRATIGGGELNRAQGGWSAIAGGLQASAPRHGQFAHAAGQISQKGDAQFSLYVLRKQTQNNSQADLNLDGNGLHLDVPFGAVWSFSLRVTAMQVTGTNFAAYEVSGVAANINGGLLPANLQLRDPAGNLLPVGSTLPPIYETPSAGTWQATPYLAGAGIGTQLRIAVNGGAGQGAINWVATLQTTELLK